jgi:putative sterol carrier protein
MASKEDVLAVLEAMKDRMSEPEYQAKLGSVTKSLQFDCTDLKTAYVMEIKDGKVISLDEKTLPAPDIKAITDSDTFIGVAGGKVNAMSAFMSGKLQVKAALPDLLMLQQLLQ